MASEVIPTRFVIPVPRRLPRGDGLEDRVVHEALDDEGIEQPLGVLRQRGAVRKQRRRSVLRERPGRIEARELPREVPVRGFRNS